MNSDQNKQKVFVNRDKQYLYLVTCRLWPQCVFPWGPHSKVRGQNFSCSWCQRPHCSADSFIGGAVRYQGPRLSDTECVATLHADRNSESKQKQQTHLGHTLTEAASDDVVPLLIAQKRSISPKGPFGDYCVSFSHTRSPESFWRTIKITLR